MTNDGRNQQARQLPAAADPPPRWTRLGSFPVVAAVLVGLNALMMALIAFGNITDFDTNHQFVDHVLKMDTTNFGGEPGADLDPDVMWRAIDSGGLRTAGYVLIIAWETLAALVLIAAVVAWIAERRAGHPRARALSVIGLLKVILLFFGGFLDIGGEWFQMWRSSAWNGTESALRNIIVAAIPLLLLFLPAGRDSGRSTATADTGAGER
ncbi:DUF2165 domain-containing protein [Nakamurella aerolata]